MQIQIRHHLDGFPVAVFRGGTVRRRPSEEFGSLLRPRVGIDVDGAPFVRAGGRDDPSLRIVVSEGVLLQFRPDRGEGHVAGHAVTGTVVHDSLPVAPSDQLVAFLRNVRVHARLVRLQDRLLLPDLEPFRCVRDLEPLLVPPCGGQGDVLGRCDLVAVHQGPLRALHGPSDEQPQRILRVLRRYLRGVPLLHGHGLLRTVVVEGHGHIRPVPEDWCEHRIPRHRDGVALVQDVRAVAGPPSVQHLRRRLVVGHHRLHCGLLPVCERFGFAEIGPVHVRVAEFEYELGLRLPDCLQGLIREVSDV